MPKRWIISIGVGLLFGSIAFLTLLGFSALAWKVFPYPVRGGRETYLLRWQLQVITEKLFGLIVTVIISVWAARAYHPTARWGIASGLFAASFYQGIAVAVYLCRFGVPALLANNPLPMTLGSVFVFGFIPAFIAVWAQYRRENVRKHITEQ